MHKSLSAGLSCRNGFIRKGSATLLRLPKYFHSMRASQRDFATAPVVLANSFPKSGTHLLTQLVAGLPNRIDYGAFLASMTSSFQFRERTDASVARCVRAFAPGEIVRGHLFFKHPYHEMLQARRVVHFFIYRDPRDVVVSEAHFLREMNRWHRLHPFFRRLKSMEEAIALSITGFETPVPGIDYPDVAKRFARYEGWLKCGNCLPVRYEDLVSGRSGDVAERMARFYADRTQARVDITACVEKMHASVAPGKSHTFRSGKSGDWQNEFTARHHDLFANVAGDLLQRIGFETKHEGRPATVARAG